MKKLITLSLRDKKTEKKPGVKKWLRLVEERMNELITPEILAHYAMGLPVKFTDEGTIECVYPEEFFNPEALKAAYVKVNNRLRNKKQN